MATETTPSYKQLAPEETKVTYGSGRKISDGNYGSYDFHCSMSTVCQPGETPVDAVKRCIEFTEYVISNKVAQAGKKDPAKKLPY